MKQMLNLVLAGLVLLLILLAFLPSNAQALSRTITVSSGEYRAYDLDEFDEDDTMYFEMRVNNNFLIDVYILSTEKKSPSGQSEYDRYRAGEDFEAAFQRESTRQIPQISWHFAKDGDNYVLVFDNWNNSHANDADDGYAANIDFSYDGASGDIAWDYMYLCMGACCVIPIIGVVLFIFVVSRLDDDSRMKYTNFNRYVPWGGRGGPRPYTPAPRPYAPPPQPYRPPPQYTQASRPPSQYTQPPRPHQTGPAPPVTTPTPPYSSSQPRYSYGATRTTAERSDARQPPRHLRSSPPPPGKRYSFSREEEGRRNVVIQNIGEYVSGSRVSIRDSVVQRSHLGGGKDIEDSIVVGNTIISGDSDEDADGAPVPTSGEPSTTTPAETPLSDYEARKFYKSILQKAWEDAYINETEYRMLKNIRESANISLEEHKKLEEEVLQGREIKPIRCPECGKIGEYSVEKEGYFCPDCQRDL